MINVREVITPNELDLISSYIANDAREERSPEKPSISAVELLEKVWAFDKENLFEVFGKQLILTKPIECGVDFVELTHKFSSLMEDRTNPIGRFIYNWREKARDSDCLLSSFNHDGYTYRNPLEFFLYNCLCCEGLADNRCEIRRVCNFPLGDNKFIKIERETKVVKTAGRIAEAYGIEGFEEFRLEHSRIHNTAKIRGELCLSIHPLDFITLSENDNDWTSCMNWHNRGCYRRGTVEMMNSSCVIVAYLKSKTDMERYGQTWNSKKWRKLYVVNKDLIAGIKAYPYHSSDLSEIAIKWIADLFADKYDKDTLQWYEYDCGCFYHDDIELSIEMEANTMYNDFGCDVEHDIICTKSYYLSRHYNCINYSGLAQCVFCGKIINYEEDYPAERLVCSDCDAPRIGCSECGCLHYSDEIMWVQGVPVCRRCYEGYTCEDCITGQRVFYRNVTPH